MARSSRGGRTGFEGSPEIGADRKSREQVDREVREGRREIERTREARENRQDKNPSLMDRVQSILQPPTGADPGALRLAPVAGLGMNFLDLVTSVTGVEPREPDPANRVASRDSDNNRTGRQLQALSQAPAPAPAPVPVAPVPIIVPGDPANVGLRGRRRRRLLGADETGLFRTPTLLGRR